MKKFNMMMSEETRRDIRLIRGDYDLSNDAEAIRLAVQKLARHIRESLEAQDKERMRLIANESGLSDKPVAPITTVAEFAKEPRSAIKCDRCGRLFTACECPAPPEPEYVQID